MSRWRALIAFYLMRAARLVRHMVVPRHRIPAAVARLVRRRAVPVMGRFRPVGSELWERPEVQDRGELGLDIGLPSIVISPDPCPRTCSELKRLLFPHSATTELSVNDVAGIQQGELPDATLLGVVESSPDPFDALAEVFEKLRVGGRLVLVLPLLFPFDDQVELFRVTPEGCRLLLESACPGAAVDVGGIGSFRMAYSALSDGPVGVTESEHTRHRSDYVVLVKGVVSKPA